MRCILFDIPVLVWTKMICALVRGTNSTVINSTEFGSFFFETRYTAGLFSFPIISKVKHLQSPDSRFLMIYSHSCFIPSELWAFLTSESKTWRLFVSPPVRTLRSRLFPARWNRGAPFAIPRCEASSDETGHLFSWRRASATAALPAVFSAVTRDGGILSLPIESRSLTRLIRCHGSNLGRHTADFSLDYKHCGHD